MGGKIRSGQGAWALPWMGPPPGAWVAQGTFGQGSEMTPELSSVHPAVPQGRSWREEMSLAFLSRVLSCSPSLLTCCLPS